MKTTPFWLMLFCYFGVYSQDTIVTYRGSKFPATNISITDTSISFNKPGKKDNESIEKSKVWEIRYGNGSSVDFFTTAEKSMPLHEIQKQVCDLINQFGYEEDSDNQKYKATFEGDYLRLAIMKNDKVKSKGFLFDFGNVYQFHPVSERGKEIAYVNIYVAFLDNPKTMKWAKQKLIMRVHGHQNGYEIMRSLQNLNRVLRDGKKTK